MFQYIWLSRCFSSAVCALFPTPTQKDYLQQHFSSLPTLHLPPPPPPLLPPCSLCLSLTHTHTHTHTLKLNMKFWQTEALWHKAKPVMYSAEGQEYENVSTCWQSSCSCSQSLTQVEASKPTWHREEGAASCVTVSNRVKLNVCPTSWVSVTVHSVHNKMYVQNIMFHTK